MTDVVDTPQKINIKIRFKIRTVIFFAVHADFILIRIDYVSLRIIIQYLYDLIQRVRRHNIIVILQA